MLDPYFNSKEYYQKCNEIENAKFNTPDPMVYNFNPYSYYDSANSSAYDSKKSYKK